jgi:hypothetical protein
MSDKEKKMEFFDFVIKNLQIIDDSTENINKVKVTNILPSLKT